MAHDLLRGIGLRLSGYVLTPLVAASAVSSGIVAARTDSIGCG
jgi:hypothetical protein